MDKAIIYAIKCVDSVCKRQEILVMIITSTIWRLRLDYLIKDVSTLYY